MKIILIYEFILVGTKEGHLLMYKYDLKGTINKDGIEEAAVTLVKSSKNFSRKPVAQLVAVKEFQLLISLSDNVISVHDLGASDQGNFPVLETLHRTKGATLFAINIVKEGSAFEPKVTLCVVVGKRLMVLHLKGWEKRFEEAVNVRITLSEPPRALVWVSDGLFLNVSGEYQKMKLSGDYQKLFYVDKGQEPRIVPLNDGRIALGLDDKTVFAVQDGLSLTIGKEPVKWSAVPGPMTQDAPFLIALFPNHVEVRPYDPPGSNPEAVQRIDVPKARLISDRHSFFPRGLVFFASQNSVWALKRGSTEKVINLLITNKQFKLAEHIAANSESDEDLKSDWLQSIRKLDAFHLFADREFKKALDLFYDLGTEPPQIIGLFPDYLPPNIRDAIKYPVKPPELTGSAFENATLALIEYLTKWRTKLQAELQKPAGQLNEADSDKFNALMQIVDTALLKCYLTTNPALLSPLLRLPDNRCHFEECERSLMKARRFNELLILFKCRGFHKRALEFLRRESEIPDSPLSGYQRMAQYLMEIAKDELDLVFQYARFVIKASPEQGLQIFINDLYDTDQFPREKIFDFFKTYAPDLVVPYLEHAINVWNDTNPVLHTFLGESYVRQAETAVRTKEPIAAVNNLRSKLQKFLKSSDQYVPGPLLAYLPLDCMFEERALVLGRLGRYEQAIALYVHVLKADNLAEEFCEQFYDPLNPDAAQVFYLLFKTYLKPPDASTLSVLLNDPPKTESRLEDAMRILRKYSGRIDYPKAMELVPRTIPIRELSDFLITALQVLTSKRRQAELMRSLHYSEFLQLENLRIKYESEHFVIDEDTTCEICGRRLGKNTAFVRTPKKTLLHYACSISGRK